MLAESGGDLAQVRGHLPGGLTGRSADGEHVPGVAAEFRNPEVKLACTPGELANQRALEAERRKGDVV